MFSLHWHTGHCCRYPVNYTLINYSFITSVERQLHRQVIFFSSLWPQFCSSLLSDFVLIFLNIPEDLRPVVDWLKSILGNVPMNLDCVFDPILGKLETNLVPGIMLDIGNKEVKETVTIKGAQRELRKSVKTVQHERSSPGICTEYW